MLLLALLVLLVASSYTWFSLSKRPRVSELALYINAPTGLTIARNYDAEEAQWTQKLSFPDLVSEADPLKPVTYSQQNKGFFAVNYGFDGRMTDRFLPLSDQTHANRTDGNGYYVVGTFYARYGIDDLVLRPATLGGNLRDNPLQGAVYGEDGRITETNSKFTYAKWDGSQFLASKDYGVRAIASYYTQTSDASAAEYEQRYKTVAAAHTTANEFYRKDAMSRENIFGLGEVMSTYLQSKLNEKGYGTGDKNLALTTQKVTAVYNVYAALVQAMDKECDALVALANLQQYIYSREHEDVAYTELDWAELRANAAMFDLSGAKHKTGNAVSKPAEAVGIQNLSKFISDLTQANNDVATLKALVDKSNAGQQVYSNELDAAVNHLCSPSSALIDGKSLNQWMSGNKLDLLGLRSGDHLVTLGDGLLKRFEQMAIDASYRLPSSTSTKDNAASVSAKATYSGISLNINMTGHLCTSASGNSFYQDDFGLISASIDASDKIAEDTYGMAVDFWVRTNAEQTYLILEGATTTDTDGTILRYDGVNRVWGPTGNAVLTTDSTTQGGGSCYIYYADTPEDMARSLELLRSFKVAFVSQDAKLIATAEMDTQHYCAVNGRITVPLVLSEVSSLPYTYNDPDDPEQEITAYAIRQLKMDHAERITALIYLDGVSLENTDVLASANINGQLNIQFGSSENLKTIGDSTLIGEERLVSASVSKSTFDFNNDEDLTTRVTAVMQGAEPKASVKAFFIRAINATQGSREAEMTFTKQQGGSWTADYTFTAPGTYYLRYIRVDGVDYALADPPKVTVSGYGITAVNWGEATDSFTYYSPEQNYTETVSVAFDTTDPDKMPANVQAKFMRDDGIAVTIETHYNGVTNRWEGSGSFAASGTYTLSYLLLDGKYTDISRFSKKLTLYLGLKAYIYNNGSSLQDEYDPDQPEFVRSKNVQVRIEDNAGTRLQELKEVTLTYSSGGSAANAFDIDLVWNTQSGYYEGTLPLIRPGRYVFYRLGIGANILTKAEEAPVYVIASPEPPIYDTTSESRYHGEENVQFVPLTRNGVIGPIQIANSAAVRISATLYNSKTASTYTVDTATIGSGRGILYYVNSDGGYWMLNLPTYLTGGEENQDGTWSVLALALKDCFYEDAYRGEDNPLIWLGTSAQAAQYAADNKIKADQTIDFDKLSTTVSSTVNIAMEPGTTELGSKTTPFMTEYAVNSLGMYLTITDDDGRAIPADKIESAELRLSYSDNKDVETYGYEVSGYSRSFTVTMEQDAADGKWKPNSNDVWQYVGEYRVTGLTVSVAGTEKTFASGENGVPERYTITSEAPTADNLAITKIEQPQTVFGKDQNGEINGEFLASYVPSVRVEVSLTPKDKENKQYAIVPGVSMQLQMTYAGGSDANGGYTYTGSAGYESYEIPLTRGSSTKTADYVFSASESKVLLAGKYRFSGTMFWTENGKTLSKPIGELQDIEVYSVRPTLTVTGISPEGEVSVNPAGGIKAAAEGVFSAQNHYAEDYAAVYMAYDVSTKPGTYNKDQSTMDHSSQFADYTAPIVKFAIRNVGKFPSTVTLREGDIGYSKNLSADADTWQTEIGSIERETDSSNTITVRSYNASEDKWEENTYNVTYETERATVFGTHTVNTLTTKVNGATMTRALTFPVTISQTNLQAPKLTYEAAEGMLLSVKRSEGGTGIASGSMVDGMTALTVTATAQYGYYNPRVQKPENALNWVPVSETAEEAVYTLSMAFEDMHLAGTASAYPRLTCSLDESKGTVSITVADKTLSGGDRIPVGATVTLRVEAKDGYCHPRIALPGNLPGQTAQEGDHASVYTFEMPQQDVALSATFEQAYRIYWKDNEIITYSAQDLTENKEILQGGSVVPGHTVLITLYANGGTNPHLTAPTYAKPYGNTEDPFIRQYSFAMPSEYVTLNGTADAYPILQFGNSYASVTRLASGNVAIEVGNVTGKGIKPLQTVEITLTAKAGYYAPRMAQPDGVTNWQVIGTPDNGTATYRFTMPNTAVDAASKITATEAQAVTVDAANTSVTMNGTNYDGSALTGGRVQPGTVVTVTVEASAGYFNPAATATGAALSKREGDYDKATYTFTMGTEPVTLKAFAVQDPLVTVNANGVLSDATVNGVKNQTRVHPGKTATVVLTADALHYQPTLSIASGTVTNWKEPSSMGTSANTYTFTMGTEDVALKAAASQKRKLSWIAKGAVISSVKYNGAILSSDDYDYVIPGGTVQINAALQTGYVDLVITASPSPGQISNGAFVMPDSDVKVKVSATPTLTWTNKDGVNPVVKYGPKGTYDKGGSYDAEVEEGTPTAVPAGKEVYVKVEGKVERKSWFTGAVLKGSGGYFDLKGDVNKDSIETKTNPKDSIDDASKNLTGEYIFLMPDSPVTLTTLLTNDRDACITGETLITLADGSSKQVKEMNGTEELLVWNHMTGAYDTAPVAYLIDHGGEETEQQITHLYFSDGSDLEIIGEHVFYDADLGKYITLDGGAEAYLGHHFAKQNLQSGTMERVALTDVKHQVRVSGAYEVVSNSYMSCFTNGILTASAYIDKLLNIFEIDPQSMACNPFDVVSDIQKYGLYSYEDLQEIATREEFEAHNAAFLKIAVGKGTLTWDDLCELTQMYRAYAKVSAVSARETASPASRIPQMFGNYFVRETKKAVQSLSDWRNSIADTCRRAFKGLLFE